jgi:hypothetical protein
VRPLRAGRYPLSVGTGGGSPSKMTPQSCESTMIGLSQTMAVRLS